MRNSYNENIQEHSFQVAIISHAIAEIKNVYFDGKINSERAALIAMYHDSDEIITGDMPTPIKYLNSEITEAYKKIESASKNKLLSMLPEKLMGSYSRFFLKVEEDKEIWKIVKAADKISAYLKCIEEEKIGNKEFKKAKEHIYKTIIDIDLPEVRFFVDNFVPSFELSIDELD